MGAFMHSSRRSVWNIGSESLCHQVLDVFFAQLKMYVAIVCVSCYEAILVYCFAQAEHDR
jgi:hypothetical protein